MTTDALGHTPAQDEDALASLRRGKRRRLGDVLVEQHVLTREQVEEAVAVQAQEPVGRRRRLGALVVQLGMASEAQVAKALADAVGLELVDLGRTLVVPEDTRLLPRAFAERTLTVVLEKNGNHVRVAAADPTNVVALDDVRLYTRTESVSLVVATESQVREQINRAWALAQEDDLSILFEQMEPDDGSDDDASQAVESAPVVRMVDVLLAEAVRARASDIHVEPQLRELRIRYRVDGVLRDVMTLPKHATAAVISRIKIVSGLDIAERRRPQDGRAKLTVDGTSIEARISTLPTVHGEKVVMRLLGRSQRLPALTESGLLPDQLELLRRTLSQSQGLVLITGPTGSGKTSTLYAALREISTPDRHVVTLEDPVEAQIPGITQVQVHERAGLTFARGLRSVLRQDPDVVLVGEARDQETAELALTGSLTGHLVLTTLHTNDSVSALTRLVEMGAEPFLVASSLSLVVAQRLLRRPCPSCATSYTPDDETLTLLGLTAADLAGATPTRGEGCTDCAGTGYHGRVGVFEVLPVTAALRKVLLSNPTEAAVGAAARDLGLVSLRSHALAAAARGETTYEEVLRATHGDAASTVRCPSCSRSLDHDMACCPWDGTVVAHDRCTGCDRALDREWHHCPWCRTEVPAPAAALPQLPQQRMTDGTIAQEVRTLQA
jgi:type IV pilus assembly protein PilB